LNTRGQLVAGNQNWNTQVQGTDVDLPLIQAWELEQGAFFTPQDVTTAAKVAVIGSVVRDQLFGPDVNPVGQVMRIQKQPFNIVGVLKSKGQTSMGQDRDDVVMVPYTTVMKKIRGVTFINNVTVSAASANEVTAVADRISTLLRVRHKVQPGDPDDFMVRTIEEMASVRKEATQTMTALLASIAGVSLLVGGIGIMNIMLVSVTERTREIGLRMAVGARGRDILGQFLVEAVTLSMIGGLIGIVVGIIVSYTIPYFAGWRTLISAEAIALAFAFAAAVGIFFGFYPARKAALLNPIEALRYE
jgi:putative ABC transport system permease protein